MPLICNKQPVLDKIIDERVQNSINHDKFAEAMPVSFRQIFIKIDSINLIKPIITICFFQIEF